MQGETLRPVAFANRSSAPEIACACANRDGGVWFGTEQDGLHFVQSPLVRVFTTRDGFAEDEVRAVCVGRNGRLWAGDHNWREGRWERVGPGWLGSVAESPAGELWVGLNQAGLHSLWRFVPQTASDYRARYFDVPDLPWAAPNSLRFASSGTLWVTCQRGLTWVTSECQRTGVGELGKDFGRFATGRELPEAHLIGLLEDHDGSIWAGTMGQGRIHVKDQRVERFTQRDGLAGEFCAPALADALGAVWIVTNGGISRRKGGRFQSIRSADGLPNDHVIDLVEDDFGYFWLPGKRGIHRLERRELEAFFDGRLAHVQSITLGVRDGLLTPECSSWGHPVAAKTPDGRIWVATRSGLAMFDPGRVRLHLQTPPTLLERLVVNRKEFPLRSAGIPAGESLESKGAGKDAGAPVLRLPAGSGRQLEFHYTSISLTAAERMRFRHRLDGLDADWAPETDLRLAFYTNLRPGAYCFRVKSANARGVWNEEAAPLNFVIAPYFWETKTFWAALVACIAAVVLALHRHRLRTRRRLQELKHEQALIAEKTRIAADMHDDLGATLTQIVILGETAKSQATNAPQTRAALDRISQSARDMTSRLSDLIWAINPRHDTLDNLAAFLREHAARQFEGTAIRAGLDFGPLPADCHVSATFRRNLVLVVKEAFHNVLKHSGAIELRLQLSIEANALVIRIEDNGRGFDVPARTGTGNGLLTMRQRRIDLGGSLEIQSTAGRGTQLRIQAPLPSVSAAD